MTLTPIIFLSTFLINPTKAANFADFEFAKVLAGSGTADRIKGVTTDSSENLYISGESTQTIDLDPDNVVAGDTHVGGATARAFLAKYNSSGVLQWDKYMGTGTAEDIHVDSSGNVYAGGSFSGSFDTDEDNVVAGDTLLPNGGGSDAFLAKYNSSGLLQWAKSWGSTGLDSLTRIKTDASGNVYFVGTNISSGAVDYDQDNVVAGDTHTRAGGYDIVAGKFNSSGVLQWVKVLGDSDDDFLYDLGIDSGNNIYVVGSYENTGFDLDEDNVVAGDTVSTTGTYQGFIAKYNSNGVAQWVRQLGDSSGDLEVSSVAVDSNDNVLTTGYFCGTVDFDLTGVTAGDIKSDAEYDCDIFILKLNSSGSFQWVKAIGGSDTFEFTESISVDPNDNIYINGESYADVIDFDRENTINGDTVDPNGVDYVYMAKYDNNGVFQIARHFGEVSTTSLGPGTVDDFGNMYATFFQYDSNSDEEVDLDPTAVTPGDYITGRNTVVVKYSTYVATRVENLAGTLSVIDTVTSKDAASYDQDFVSGTRTLRLETSGGLVIGEIDTDMSIDLDWSSVTADSDIGTGTAFVHNLTSAPGTAATFTLYVPKLPAHSKVTICPGADALVDLVPACPGAFDRTAADGDTSIVNIGGQDYWAITGLSGTGGFGGTETNSAAVYIDLNAQPATSPGTISTAPEVAVSTTDQFYLSYVASSSEFGIGDIIDVAIPFDWTGLAVCSSPADADGDAGNDHTVALVNPQQIRYTFTAVTTSATTTGVEVCFEATTPAAPGNYSIAVSDDNDNDFGAALIYVGDANDVTITATVPATISLRIKEPTTTTDTNICELGVLNPASVNSCSYRIAAGTNSATGLEVFVLADDQLNTAGDTSDIDDVAGGGVVTAGNEEHGILVTLGTGYTIGGAFSETTDELVPLVQTLILDAAAAVSDSDTATWSTITHSASVNSSSLAGAYDQIIIYRAWVGT